MNKISKKISHAENQQERLPIMIGWVVGFVDGEGCFSINFVRQSDRKKKIAFGEAIEPDTKYFMNFRLLKVKVVLKA